jgi:hypothetical protein
MQHVAQRWAPDVGIYFDSRRHRRIFWEDHNMNASKSNPKPRKAPAKPVAPKPDPLEMELDADGLTPLSPLHAIVEAEDILGMAPTVNKPKPKMSPHDRAS